MYANRRNFRVLKEISVEELDVDVKFFTGSWNMAVSCMSNASGQEQFVHCGLGYGADTTFHRTYF